MNILETIFNWIRTLLGHGVGHVQPPKVVGSDNYTVPPIDNVGQNWLSYLSQPYRTQWAGNFDEDNCATRAAIEQLEAILNYYLKNNLFPDILATFLKEKFCNSQGYVKLSIRYNAKLNNTTTAGVSVDTVWNNFSNYGIVPESVYPDPHLPFGWRDYYSSIPDNIVSFGKNTLTLFQINWQTLWNNRWEAPDLATVRQALQTSPIYFAGPVGQRDASGIEQWMGDRIYKHARIIYNEDGYQEIMDSYAYPDYLRKLSQSFPLPCAIKAEIKII